MSAFLPAPYPITTFTVEDKYITFTAPAGTVPVGGIGAWTVELVICDGEGGPILLRQTLGAQLVLTNATLAIWDTVISEEENRDTITAGNWWYNFNRTDTGHGLVIARGPYEVKAVSSGG